MSRLESQYAENKVLSNLVALPNLDTKATKERMDGIFKVTAEKTSGNKRSESRVSEQEESDFVNSSENSLQTDETSEEMDSDRDDVEFEDNFSESENNDAQE